ncbi:His Kinase A (phospho-acceptor) domain-containing protein [Cyclonatronum proteinivorum]|uniref:histidine kinase n=1 Tax=Cyclonatronum proteinivorum TaxID=1457365 RepID=A0A345UMU2_9BACT|nr:HAMP domain-containing sensor histidine kinase [Cyclonatronum proteinivorum]AXJ01794.1 His Kinase A (phospho-acceptor) domain-containing protein [Cyclonatronum proteinivorum]
MNNIFSTRRMLLALGIIGVLALTGMNLYSIYALHMSAVTTSVEKNREQLDDLSQWVRVRLRQNSGNLWRLEASEIRRVAESPDAIPEPLLQYLRHASADQLFDDIFFTFDGDRICSGEAQVLRFDGASDRLVEASNIPEQVCRGVGLVSTRMNVLSSTYKWTAYMMTDSYFTFNFVFFNPDEAETVAYISMPINRDYLISGVVGPEIRHRFGDAAESGVLVYLDDWTQRQVLVSNDAANKDISRDHDFIARFSGILEDWNLKMRHIETPEVAASKATLVRNIAVLAVTVFTLMFSLLFLYIVSKRDRELSMRQASFLANVTHELKTPLAVMQAAGENLADGRVTTPERLQSYGEHIFTESMRLRKMIEKLLDVARTEAGQLTLKPMLLQPDSLVKDHLHEQQGFLNQNNVELDLHIEDDIPKINVDQNSFETILGNLIENAVKYSQNEKYLGIHVYSNQKKVFIEVEDRGTGIPAESQKLIFEKFYRVEDTLTARTKGHGLGLSIVKNLTERNGGQISLSSTYGKGSTFTISFPIAANATFSKQHRPKQNEEESKAEYV